MQAIASTRIAFTTRVTSQWMMGKAGDGWGPVGPWVVSADQVDPQNLNLETRVNGEVRQSSNTSRMIFSIRQQIAYLSRHLTLEAGDLIFTGTPAGVGGLEDPPRYLAPGDVIVSEVEGLGSMENRCVPAPRAKGAGTRWTED